MAAPVEEYTIKGLGLDGEETVRTFKFIYAHCSDPLAAEDLEALRRGIFTHGIRDAITVDPDGGVVGGQNRIRLAVELKIPLEKIPINEISETGHKAEELAVMLNLLGRERSKDVRLKRAIDLHLVDKWGNRKIANALGVDEGTIRYWFKKAGVVSPETVKTSDGREYPSSPRKALRKDSAMLDGEDQAGDDPAAGDDNPSPEPRAFRESPPPAADLPNDLDDVDESDLDANADEPAAPPVDPYLQKQKDEPVVTPFDHIGEWSDSDTKGYQRSKLRRKGTACLREAHRIFQELGGLHQGVIDRLDFLVLHMETLDEMPEDDGKGAAA